MSEWMLQACSRRELKRKTTQKRRVPHGSIHKLLLGQRPATSRGMLYRDPVSLDAKVADRETKLTVPKAKFESLVERATLMR